MLTCEICSQFLSLNLVHNLSFFDLVPWVMNCFSPFGPITFLSSISSLELSIGVVLCHCYASNVGRTIFCFYVIIYSIYLFCFLNLSICGSILFCIGLLDSISMLVFRIYCSIFVIYLVLDHCSDENMMWACHVKIVVYYTNSNRV